MKRVLHIILLFVSTILYAQVGINTADPNSILDIRSSNEATPANTDGILIPKVDEFSVTPPTALQDGMIVYVTGDGSETQGFYYWDNGTTTWIPFASSDADWFEEGTSTAPDDISDDIFTGGNVAIGKKAVDYRLDVEETIGSRGINTSISGTTAGTIYGSYVANSNTGGGLHVGTYNELTGVGIGEQMATRNDISNTGDGDHNGVYNEISGTGNGVHYGIRNEMSGTGSGSHFGSYNFLQGTGTGVQYGHYVRILNSGDAQHIGS